MEARTAGRGLSGVAQGELGSDLYYGREAIGWAQPKFAGAGPAEDRLLLVGANYVKLLWRGCPENQEVNSIGVAHTALAASHRQAFRR